MNFKPFTTEDFKNFIINENVTVVDTRDALDFSDGYIPGSVFIGLQNEKFAEWAKLVLPNQLNILIVAEKGKEETAGEKLTEAGFNVIGYLKYDIKEWKKLGEEIDMVINVEADEFAMDIPFDEKMVIIDVRTEEEYNKAHVKNAVNIPLDQITDTAVSSNLEEEDNHYIYCGSGYRSLIASSILKKQGMHNLRNISGGFDEIKSIDKIPLEKQKVEKNSSNEQKQ